MGRKNGTSEFLVSERGGERRDFLWVKAAGAASLSRSVEVKNV